MPAHSPYRSPVTEFSLWTIWTLARGLSRAGHLLRRLAGPTRATLQWLHGAAVGVARCGVRVGRWVGQMLADAVRRGEDEPLAVPLGLLAAVMAGLAGWMLLLVVTR